MQIKQINDLADRLAEQYKIIEQQRLQLSAQRQVLEELIAWGNRQTNVSSWHRATLNQAEKILKGEF